MLDSSPFFNSYSSFLYVDIFTNLYYVFVRVISYHGEKSLYPVDVS